MSDDFDGTMSSVKYDNIAVETEQAIGCDRHRAWEVRSVDYDVYIIPKIFKIKSLNVNKKHLFKNLDEKITLKGKFWGYFKKYMFNLPFDCIRAILAKSAAIHERQENVREWDEGFKDWIDF